MLNASVALHINRRIEPVRNTLRDLCKSVDKAYILCERGLKCRLEQDDVQSLHSPRHKLRAQVIACRETTKKYHPFWTSGQFWRKEIVREVNFYLVLTWSVNVEKNKGRLNNLV